LNLAEWKPLAQLFFYWWKGPMASSLIRSVVFLRGKKDDISSAFSVASVLHLVCALSSRSIYLRAYLLPLYVSCCHFISLPISNNEQSTRDGGKRSSLPGSSFNMLSDVHSRSRNAVGMVNFPTITFDNETAEYNLLARDSLERQLGVHHLYSDGSFNNVDDDANTRMSFAEAYKNVGKTYEPAISGTVLGHASSTRVEIIGILAAILCCPRNHPAKYIATTSRLSASSAH